MITAIWISLIVCKYFFKTFKIWAWKNVNVYINHHWTQQCISTEKILPFWVQIEEIWVSSVQYFPESSNSEFCYIFQDTYHFHLKFCSGVEFSMQNIPICLNLKNTFILRSTKQISDFCTISCIPELLPQSSAITLIIHLRLTWNFTNS